MATPKKATTYNCFGIRMKSRRFRVYLSFESGWRQKRPLDPGGRATTIYAGKGCTIFWMPFFEQKINFGVSSVVKSEVVINFEVLF